MLPAVIILYTPMVICTMLIWPMSPAGVCKAISDPIGLLSDGGANGGLASTDVCMLEYIK